MFSFADDNSLYSCGINLNKIFSNLMQDMKNVYEWFVYNSIKTNPDKLKFIILGNTGSHSLQMGNVTIKLASSVTLLGIAMDSKLNFKEHLNNIAKKHIINFIHSKTTKVSRIRESFFNNRK